MKLLLPTRFTSIADQIYLCTKKINFDFYTFSVFSANGLMEISYSLTYNLAFRFVLIHSHFQVQLEC